MRTKPSYNLLHNMSAPPKSTVKYAGLNGLMADNGRQYPGENLFGLPVRFELSHEYAGLDAADILSLIGVKPGSGKGKDPSKQLTTLINECAMKLPLPEGCAVIP